MWVSRNSPNIKSVKYGFDEEYSYKEDVNSSSYVVIWKNKPYLNKTGRWVGRGQLFVFCAQGFSRSMGLKIGRGQCFKLTGTFSNPKLGQRVFR